MKHLAALMIASVCLAAPCILAQNTPAAPPSAPKVGPAPKITFKSEVLDFGRIPDDKLVEGTFELKNEGDAPLVLTSLGADCGCTEPTINGQRVEGGKQTKVNVEVKPGETATISIKFNPLGKQDLTKQKVTIGSNDPARPDAIVTVQAVVDPIVRVDPKVWNIGDIVKGRPFSLKVKVYGQTPDFMVNRVSMNGVDGFDAKVLSTKDVEVEGRKLREVEVEISTPGVAKPALIAGTATVRTNDIRRRFVSAAVTGRIVGDLEPDSNRVAFGTVKVGDSAYKTLRITSRTGTPFKIVGIDQSSNLTKDGVTPEVIPIKEEGKVGYDIRLALNPQSAKVNIKGSLIIKTDVKDEEKVEVVFVAIVE